MRKTAALPGIAGNDLNRCGVPALQHKIRAKIKRIAVFFANSRLRVVRMGRWGAEKDCFWIAIKERFVQIKGFLYVKRQFLRTVKSCSNERYFGCENERLLRAKHKAFCKRKPFGLRKRRTFSAHEKFTDKEKLFLSAPRLQFPTAPKLTSNCIFHPR